MYSSSVTMAHPFGELSQSLKQSGLTALNRAKWTIPSTTKVLTTSHPVDVQQCNKCRLVEYEYLEGTEMISYFFAKLQYLPNFCQSICRHQVMLS